MRRIRIRIAIAGMAIVTAVVLFAENVEWSRIGYKRQGMLIQTPTGESLPVSGSFTLDEATNPDSGIYVKPATGYLFYPADYADSTHQETGNDLLDAINTKIPASPSDSTRQDTANALLEDIKTATERLDDLTLPETGFTERFEVNGYAETSKSYTNISHVEVYVQTADKTVRLGLFGNDTSTNYVDIAKSETPGWVRSNVRFPAFDMKFKGNTETDTAIVVVQGWQYIE